MSLIILRGIAALSAFIIVTVGSYLGGIFLFTWAASSCELIVSNPSTDLCGRGHMAAADVGIGPFICLLLGVVAAWLALLWTSKRNWTIDLFVASPIFIVFSVITSANYISRDVIFTRNAQAILNVLLFSSGVAVVAVLQHSSKKIESKFAAVLGAAVLAFCLYAFVAIPLWYSLSFLSWKLGAGELGSLDAAAKAVGAAISLLAMIGIIWKNGHIEFDSAKPD